MLYSPQIFRSRTAENQGIDLTPPQPDTSVFFKIIKRGVVGGGKDDGRGWEGRGGLAEEGES